MRTAIVLLLLLTVFFGCENGDQETVVEVDQTPLPDAFKGYELYSWEANGQWKFTLITGTNRNKTFNEIVSGTNAVEGDWVKFTVTGTVQLKQLLQRVSTPEDISWINTPVRVAGFSLPSAAVIAEIEDHCKSLGLNLSVVK